MQGYKVAINKNTNETRLLLYESEQLISPTISENEDIVTADGYIGLLKPLWNGEKWSESATEEELNRYNNANENGMILV